MSNEIEKPKTALEAMASRLQVSKDALQTTLKKTAFSGCKTNEEFIACVLVANNYKLNPFMKEIYAFPAKGGGIIPIVSIDGWIKISRNHPDYNGVELTENKDAKGKVESVTARFHMKGIDNPVVVTEYMSECCDSTKTPWQKWPVRMLRHKAYIQGARVAFGFSGIYDEDEAHRIVEGQEIQSVEDKPSISMPKPKNQDKPIDADTDKTTVQYDNPDNDPSYMREVGAEG